MAMKYQKGTVYPSGKKVKMWYGKYLIYGQDKEGKEVRKHRNVSICPKAGNPKWKAEQLLREMILKECGVLAEMPSVPPDESVTFRWFVKERYIPMRQGKWSPAYKQTNTDQIERYLISKFGDLPLRKLDSFQIQIWLNGLAEKSYSESVVRSSFSNIRAITAMARKQKFLTEDPGEDVKMPQTKTVEKPVMTQDQILGLVNGIEDMHDLCLLQVGIFCGPRASEVMGLQWKSWTGESLQPYGTAYEGQFYSGRLKTKQSKAPIPVPEQVRPVIEAWRKLSKDSSPEALMFPTFGRGERKGQAVPRWGKNFLKWRIRPDRPEAGYPGPARHLSGDAADAGNRHAAARDAEGHAGHVAAREHQDDGDVYVQTIEQSVLAAVNSRTSAVLGDWKMSDESLGLKGRNLKGLNAIRRSSAKSISEVAVSC